MTEFKYSDNWVSNMTPYTIASMQAASSTNTMAEIMTVIQKTIVSGPVIFDTDDPYGWTDMTFAEFAKLITDIGIGYAAIARPTK